MLQQEQNQDVEYPSLISIFLIIFSVPSLDIKKQFWNYHSLILEKQSFQLSTNGIESINRSITHFLGLGMCNQTRLNREMNLSHRQKVNWADAALNHGRMKAIRRQTLANQDSLLNFLQKFEKLSESEKIQNLHYHVLDCGT